MESLDPPRVTLSLQLSLQTKSSDKKTPLKTAMSRELIIEYLTDHACAKSGEIAELLGVKGAWARRLLGELVKDGIVAAEGANRNRVYKLKA